MPFFNQWTNTDEFCKEAQKFDKYGYYIEYPEGTYEYDKYWDEQERIIEEGMVNSVGMRICGLHYFYLNFVQIYNKEKKKLAFPDFWDTDAWIFDEIERAQKEGKHIVLVKARQKGGSVKFVSIPLKKFYLNRFSINYIAGYIEDKADRAWEMMEHMANHLDRNTDWKKNKNPYKKDFWKSQFKEMLGEKEVWSGYKSEMHKLTLKQNPAYGVGGAVDTFLYDEAGLAKTLLHSILYVDPACSDGAIRTGTMLIVGSVGELDDCQGLKEVFYNPDKYGFLAVDNVWDEKGGGTTCGLFIPEYYSLKGYIDEWGNSKLDEAKEYCLRQRDQKKKQDPEQYRLYMSQRPFSPEEAFQFRRESIFPTRLIEEQMMSIEQNSLHGRTVFLDWDINGKVYYKDINKSPIREFPIKDHTNKEGVIVLWEEPPKEGAPWGMYYAGVDPVRNIKTTTSKSLSSVYIFKRSVQKGTEFVGDEIVACYTGRYDDPDKTNEEIEKLIELYNAQALVENDVTSFIEHMIKKRKQRFLLKKQDVPIIQELNLNQSNHAVYGITGTTPTKKKIYEMMINYLKEEFDKIFDAEGKVVRTIRGTSKIRDIMLLTEMRDWHEDLNVDRIMAFGYALMAARSQAQHTYMKQDPDTSYLEKNKEIIKGLNKSPFRYIGNSTTSNWQSGMTSINKNPFKNIK
jgi:hypothetical protein